MAEQNALIDPINNLCFDSFRVHSSAQIVKLWMQDANTE